MNVKKLRVLMITDSIGHTRGYHLVSTILRDAGAEVILGGLQTPSEIASAAVQEDVDMIGYHIMCGDPATLAGTLIQELKRRSAEHIGVVVGGTVLPWRVDEVKKVGVKEVFLPSSTMQSIVDFFLGKSVAEAG